MSNFPENGLPSSQVDIVPTEQHVPLGASWQEQDPVLRELWISNQPPQVIAERLGRSIPAIMTRAARLGLPRRAAPGRKPTLRNQDGTVRDGITHVRRAPAMPAKPLSASAQTSLRVCLMCLSKFESLGRHNRICSSCKGSAEYESATSLPELHVPVT